MQEPSLFVMNLEDYIEYTFNGKEFLVFTDFFAGPDNAFGWTTVQGDSTAIQTNSSALHSTETALVPLRCNIAISMDFGRIHREGLSIFR